MGFINFCCYTKNFNAKQYCIIALVINGLKFALSIISLFLIDSSLFFFGFLSGFLETPMTIANIIFMIFVLIYINNGSAFDKNNKCSKILCMIEMVFSGIVLLIRFLGLIIGIILYAQSSRWIKNLGIGKARTSDWIKLILPYIIYLVIEVIHFLAVNYLYKLLSLKTNSNYNEYEKNGVPVEQVSVTNAQITQNQPVLVTNMPQVSSQDNSGAKV